MSLATTVLRSVERAINWAIGWSGLVVKLDYSYRAIYLWGGENFHTRTDESTGKVDAEFLRKFVDTASTVLDIGCGGGRVEKFLAPYCGKCYGVDISPVAVKLAKTQCAGLENCFFEVIKGPSSLRDFPRDSFDFIFSISTIQHMEKEDAWCYLIEMFRLVRPGGKVCIDFPRFTDYESFAVFAENAWTGNRFLTRMHYFSKEEVEYLIERAGFSLLLLGPHYRFSATYLALANKPQM